MQGHQEIGNHRTKNDFKSLACKSGSRMRCSFKKSRSSAPRVHRVGHGQRKKYEKIIQRSREKHMQFFHHQLYPKLNLTSYGQTQSQSQNLIYQGTTDPNFLWVFILMKEHMDLHVHASSLILSLEHTRFIFVRKTLILN